MSQKISQLNTVKRIGAFALALALVFALASVAGARIGPAVDEDSDAHSEEASDMNGHAPTVETAATLPGLAVAQDGFRLVPEHTSFEGDERELFAFRIVDEDGSAVREFDVSHERRMHLIVVRRDFANFQHLHPRMRDDGTWEAAVDLSDGGAYGAFADFATEGSSLTLATDLFAAGDFTPRALPPEADTAPAGDGYEVSLEPGSADGELRFTVTRDGRRVGSVEPYLGADGHLVALREHDQAFLHTHPEGEAGGSGPIAFQVSYPTPGRYRLFLQFKHGGEVRTAAFTQEVGDAAGAHGEAEHGDH